MSLTPSIDPTESLVRRAQQGDREAHDLLVRQLQDAAFGYAFSILGDYELAEDAKQEALVSAYCDLMALRDPAAFPAWLRKIVHRHCVNLIRKRRILTVPIENVREPASDDSDALGAAQAEEERQAVRKAIARLPDHERPVVELFYIKECSLKETARQTGISVQAVKNRLHSARARLREHLMERVKDTVKKRYLTGDTAPRDAAVAEALARLDKQASQLLRFPSSEDLEQGADILCAKGRLLRFTGRPDEAIASFEKVRDIPGLPPNATRQARLRAEIGLTCLQSSDYSRAKQEFRGSRATLNRLNDRSYLAASVLNGLGMCSWSHGDFRNARSFYQKAENAAHAAHNALLETEARNNLALLDWKSGHLTKALGSFRLCLRRWKKMNNRYWWPVTLMHIGIIEENLGRYADAQSHYEESLAMAQETEFLQLQSAVQANLANLALVRRCWAQARRFAEESYDLAHRLGDRRSQAIALENLALAHIGGGAPADARKALGRARRVAKAIGDTERAVSLDLVMVEERLERGALRDVNATLDSARESIESHGYQAEMPRLLRLRAHALLVAGDASDCGKALDAAENEARKQGNRPEQDRIERIEKRLAETE